MKSSTTFAERPASDRVVRSSGILIALVGLAIVVGGGVLVGTDNAVIAGAIVAGVVGALVIVTLYLRAPFWAIGMFWVFLLLQDTMATALGKSSALGTLVKQLENPILVMLLICSLLFGNRRARGRWLVYTPALVFLAAGFLGDLLGRVPPNIALLGGFLGTKFWALLVISALLPWDEAAARRIRDLIIGCAVPVAVLAFVDFIAPGQFRAVLNLPRTSDIRLGLEASRSIFGNPALLSSFMSLALAALLARMTFDRRRWDVARVVLLFGASVLSLRLKALLGGGAAFIVVVALRPRSLGRRIAKSLPIILLAFAVAAPTAIGVVAKQVETYSTTDTPRNRLTSTSLEIAQDKAPLGVGFGRYGSAPSGPPYGYSPVYDHYGLSSVRGLSRVHPDFLHDTSWATVIGETGILGWLAFAGGLAVLWLVLFMQASNPEQRRVGQLVSVAAAAALAAYILDSSGRPAIFDAFASMNVALLIGPALALGRLPGRAPRRR